MAQDTTYKHEVVSEQEHYDWSVKKIKAALEYNRLHADKSYTTKEVRAMFGLDED